ncbi:hypothetical protein [Novosphingobium malaysiense]|uniref:hypothetical protein n=1 Tax=Novosphingobium malaysiense TaxID=1348853 RepID=UPI0012DFF657|nr:hypothetical protein [Novosphingobium malaysiense]
MNRIGTKPVTDESVFAGLMVLLQGRQTYPLDLVGTGRRQAEISAILKRRCRSERRHRALAVLTIDPHVAPGRPNVAALIEGAPVGYLPGYLATQYREWLKSWSLCRASVHCRALLHMDRVVSGGAPGEYRVKLDIEMPFRMTTIQA